jgi:hypothetical protein
MGSTLYHSGAILTIEGDQPTYAEALLVAATMIALGISIAVSCRTSRYESPSAIVGVVAGPRSRATAELPVYTKNWYHHACG